MKEWVTQFLIDRMGKRTETISEEEYRREIAVPSFCFRRLANLFRINFSANTRLTELFGSVISDLPEEVFLQLLSTRNLFFFYTEALAFVQALDFAGGEQGILCVFPEKLLSFSDLSVRGGVIHELSHILLSHYTAEAQELSFKADLENEADKKARELGFGFEVGLIRESLKSMSLI